MHIVRLVTIKLVLHSQHLLLYWSVIPKLQQEPWGYFVTLFSWANNSLPEKHWEMALRLLVQLCSC